MSRAQHATVSTAQILNIDFEDIIGSYDRDNLYGLVNRSLKGEEISNEAQRRMSEGLLAFFHLHGKRLLYEGKICVPRKSVSSVLEIVHDEKAAGHLGFSKTMSGLKIFYWKHKSRDFKNYVRGCTASQQKKTTWERS